VADILGVGAAIGMIVAVFAWVVYSVREVMR